MDNNKSLEGIDILIIEDDKIFAKILSDYLMSMGAKVRLSYDGLDGLVKIRESIPNILISDLAMPLLDGIEMTEEVSIQYPMLPVIIISGTDNLNNVATVLKFGVKDFFIKPISDLSKLRDAILVTLERSSNDFDGTLSWPILNDISELKELEKHVDYLNEHPDFANNLIRNLMPKHQSNFGKVNFNFNYLHTVDSIPLLYDYNWHQNGEVSFFITIITEKNYSNVLISKSLYNSLSRNESDLLSGIDKFIEQQSLHIKTMNDSKKFKTVIGFINFQSYEVKLFSNGINFETNGLKELNNIKASRGYIYSTLQLRQDLKNWSMTFNTDAKLCKINIELN